MLAALGGTFGLAMGLALSPVAITAVLVLLTGERRGTLRAAAFTIGWAVGMFVITLIPTLLINTAHDDDPADTATGIDILHLVFAVLFFALAVVTWIKRPAHDRSGALTPAAAAGAAGTDLEREALDLEPADKEGFLAKIDHMGVGACLGLGVGLAIVIIKNIPLAISAGSQLGSAEITVTAQVIDVVIFAVLASLGVLLPLFFSVIGGARVDHKLHDWRNWIEANMTAITLVVLLVVGVIFLGEGLGVAG